MGALMPHRGEHAMPENLLPSASEPSGEIVLYQSENGTTRIEVRLEGETVWLPQRAMAELFQSTNQNVSLHIQHIVDEGELNPEATVKHTRRFKPKGTVRSDTRLRVS
jgi:hypothetical protein